MSNNAHDLSNRLLNALDTNYNVVDMQAVNEIISILEKFNITKELLETTRLGKYVNELRRKTTDPTLARRAKVLVKRWRDLVIPAVASPGHTGSNRSSAERQVRRLGGTPLTSPALSRVVSPAVNSPRPPSRPAWGGYESDSQDVILVDDDPPPPPAPLAPPPAPAPAPAPAPPPHSAPHKPLTPPVKRPTSPVAVHDEKKAKRDKKPKKRRGHSRAGSGTEATGAPPPAPPLAPASAPAPVPAPAPAPTSAPAPGNWGARNGSSERRRNGYRREKLDPYAALVNKLPPAGAKKVKTTKELLEEIQSRAAPAPAPAPSSPRSPASPDVMLIEPSPSIVKVESPLRNGAPSPPPSPHVPLEDEREYQECTCADEPLPSCPAGRATSVRPHHVTALHHARVPGVNGTRAPLHPHRFAVRPAPHPDDPALFASVVPLYHYSDYADDYCAKNMYKVPICTHIPMSCFAPAPPSPPRPPPPPPPRPYPRDPDPDGERVEVDVPENILEESPSIKFEPIKIEPEIVGAPPLEPGDRLKPPLLSADDETALGTTPPLRTRSPSPPPPALFATQRPEHRTVEKTKELLRPDLNGRVLYEQCRTAIESIPYDYSQLRVAPELTLPIGVEREAEAEALVESVLGAAGEGEEEGEGTRDSLGRVARPARFAEWHECARLGALIALPYVVID